MRQAEKAVGVEAAGDKIGFGVELFQGSGPEACSGRIFPPDDIPRVGGVDVCSLERFVGSLDGVGELRVVPVEDALEARGAQGAFLEGAAHCCWVP